MERKPLIARVPDIWRRLDQNGELERFLRGFDLEFERLVALTGDILEFNNADGLPDKYLRLLGANLGHIWDSSKDYDWNRKKIRDAIPRASYKGTINRLSDDMIELGAESVSVQDNASKLLILSKQGRLSEPDSYMVTANFWHDGAYVLRVVDSVVPSLLRSEVEPVMRKTVPAGTIWYLQYGRQLYSIWEMDVSLLHGQALRIGNQRTGTLGFGQLIVDYFEDDNEFLSWFPNRQVQKSYYPIVWHQLGNTISGTIGEGYLGEDVVLSWYPELSPQKSYLLVYCHESETHEEVILGSFHTQYLQRVVLFDCGPALATEDTYDQTPIIADLIVTRFSFTIKQSFDQVGDFMDIEAQLTGYRENMAPVQAYLTGDSNLPGNIEDIDGNQGTPGIPLTAYQAALQAGVQKTYEEIPT